MSYGGWRAGSVGLGLAWGLFSGAAWAQAPVTKVSQTSAAVAPAHAPDVLPAVPSADVVKDLTPPGLAEPILFAEPVHKPEGLCGCAHGEKEEGGLFATAEYVLWRPRRGAFDYAIVNTSTGLATTGELKSLSYELQSGFRTALGYKFAGTGWDTQFVYTHLGSSDEARLTAGPGQVLLPTLTRPGLVDQAQTVAADASLQYNLYDLDLGKKIVIDEYFSGRVYGGIRFADIRQDFTAAYDGLDARQAFVSAKSTFYGAGPVFGLQGVFGAHKGFHLYTGVSGGLLSGKVNNPLVETNNAGQTTYVNLTSDGWQVVPTATLAIGGGWQYKSVSIRFGYEVTTWIGLTDQPRFVDDVGQGKLTTRQANLTLEGFVARLGFAF